MSRLGLEKYVSIKRTAERAVGSNSDTVRIHRITGIFAGMALLPFAVSLGLGFYIVLFGMTAAFVAGSVSI